MTLSTQDASKIDMFMPPRPAPASMISPDQYATLTQALHKGRVGTNPSGFSHVEAWDVRRTLIRVFGFGGFDIETVSCDLVQQIEFPPGSITYPSGGKNDKPRWTVVYRAQVRLTIKGPDGTPIAHYEDGACGDSSNQPKLGDAHDNAMKTALSQALKRCAVNLGDQFGLSLYNGGGGRADEQGFLRPVVMRSLVAPPVQVVDEHPGAVIDQAQDEPVLPEPTGPVDAPMTVEDVPVRSREVPERDDAGGPEPEAQEYCPPVGGSGASDAPAPPPVPSPGLVAKPKTASLPPDEVMRLAVNAIRAASSLEQLNKIEAYVEALTADNKLSFGQSGQVRLKIGRRRDEIAELVPEPTPPATP